MNSILLIDDHRTVLGGLRVILEGDPDFYICGEAETAEEALKRAGALQPDLIILDISLPDRSGIELLPDLIAIAPDSRIVVLSMFSQFEYIEKMIQHGIKGYITKESDPNVIIPALRIILLDQYFFDKTIVEKMTKKITSAPHRFIDSSPEKYDALSPREQEVFRYMAQGFSPKETSRIMKISHRTIENYKSTIMRKLDLQTAVDLVRFAQDLGLLDSGK